MQYPNPWQHHCQHAPSQLTLYSGTTLALRFLNRPNLVVEENWKSTPLSFRKSPSFPLMASGSSCNKKNNERVGTRVRRKLSCFHCT